MKHRKPPAAESSRKSLYLAAAIAALLFAGAAIYAFGKQSLFAGGHEVRAVFRDASQLRSGSAVRIAGLDIGRVTDVAASADGEALVTMRIRSDAPQLRTSDRMTVKPRLPFEGNFYVDVTEGRRDAPALQAGETIPVRQTGSSVQLDQVLSTLDGDTRDRATALVGQLASGLGTGGSRAPVGEATGVQGLRTAIRELGRAAEPVAQTARALRGETPGDLTRSLRSTAALTTTLARNPEALSDVITNYSRVINRFAAADGELRQSLRAADGLLAGAPDALRRIDAALPITRRVAADLRPVLREAPRRLPAVDRALDQVRRVARPGALPAFSRLLGRSADIAPQVAGQLQTALPMVGSIGRCLSKTVVPTAVQQIPDGIHTVDQPAWLELLHAFSGLAAASPTFDANGSTIRAGLGEGDSSLMGTIPGISDTVNVLNGGNVQGVSPQWLGNQQRPKKRVDLPCEDQDVADFSQLTNATAFQGFTRQSNRDGGLSRGEVRGLGTLRGLLSDRLRDERAASDRSAERPAGAARSTGAAPAAAPPARQARGGRTATDEVLDIVQRLAGSTRGSTR